MFGFCGIGIARVDRKGQNSRRYLDAATASCRSLDVVVRCGASTSGTEEPCSRVGGVALVLSIQSLCIRLRMCGLRPI